jgi:hypothetical protein
LLNELNQNSAKNVLKDGISIRQTIFNLKNPNEVEKIEIPNTSKDVKDLKVPGLTDANFS